MKSKFRNPTSIEEPRELSSTFPELQPALLFRDNLISLLRDKFTEANRKIVVVRGVTGSGKTTLLAQFVADNAYHCVSYFVGRDIWTSQPYTFLFDTSNQILRILGKKPVPETIEYARLKQVFSNALGSLYSHSRNQNERFYIVVDSLDRAAKVGEEGLADLIPTDLRGNVHLLLSSAASLSEQLPEAVYDEQELPSFSSAETTQFLADLGFDTRQVLRVQEASRGFPAYVAEVRRQVSQGATVDELVRALPPLVEDLFRREWARVVLTDELRNALALLVFAPEPLTIEEWAVIAGVQPTTARSWLAILSFLHADQTRGVVDFLSGPFGQFASEALAPIEDYD